MVGSTLQYGDKVDVFLVTEGPDAGVSMSYNFEDGPIQSESRTWITISDDNGNLKSAVFDTVDLRWILHDDD